MGDLLNLIIAIIFLIICYYTGRTIEKNHYKSIRQRELQLYKKPFISFSKKINSNRAVQKADLVASSVVIGCDHFKDFIASLKNIFGGNISAYESVLDRGRREAILRIREQAERMRADLVMNIKIETVMLNPIGASNNKNKHQQICVTAYGTAVQYVK